MTVPAPVEALVLAPATVDDAAELLVLQRCCWVAEAVVNGTLDIPALHEDLDDVRAWTAGWAVWTVRLRGRLVAAVRAREVDGRWEIGRLMVAPDLAGRGVGRWLLAHAESQAPPGTTAFALVTGSRSVRNIALYRRAGYRITSGSPGVGATVDLVKDGPGLDPSPYASWSEAAARSGPRRPHGPSRQRTAGPGRLWVVGSTVCA